MGITSLELAAVFMHGIEEVCAALSLGSTIGELRVFPECRGGGGVDR